MKNWCVTGLLCVCLLIVSCASEQLGPSENSVSPERIFLKGFSLLPPHENGWLVRNQNQFQLAIKRKIPEEPNKSYVILAALLPLENYKSEEEFLRLVSARQATYIYLDPQYFRVIQNETRIYPGKKETNCAKTHIMSENMVAARSGKTEAMFLENLSLTCVHPKYKGAIVEINYGHYYFAGHRDPMFLEKAESVFSSIKFDELNF